MKNTLVLLTITCMSLFLGGCNKSTPEPNVDPNQTKITVEQAKEIALKDAGLTEKDIEFLKTEQNIDDNISKYDIEFYYENKEYDYEIDANTGDILEVDNDIEDYIIEDKAVNTQNKITAEQAKEIALKHANLKSDQVKFIKETNEVDDAISKYDIEFTNENMKYNYEIDANTGDVLEFEKD
ncbi:MAG: PepSY domain-containing protein, partial [Peptostreptococcaceae bacterium]